MNLYKICEQKLKYLNYSKRTSEIYLHYMEEYQSDKLVDIPDPELIFYKFDNKIYFELDFKNDIT